MLTNCCASFIGVSWAKNMHAHVLRSRLLPNRACQTALCPSHPWRSCRAVAAGEPGARGSAKAYDGGRSPSGARVPKYRDACLLRGRI